MKKGLMIMLFFLITFLLWSGGMQEDEKKEKESEGAPVSFSIFVRAVMDFVPENNPWVDQLNEATNSKITFITASMANAWEKRNVLLASGDYPDVILIQQPNDNIYDQMRDAGKLVVLDEYLKSASNLNEYTHQISWDSARQKDGHLYMLPRCTIIREDFWFNRKDWRLKLGLPIPRTPEDWIEYSRAIATQDPDGNGRNDTYGVTDNNGLMTISASSNIKNFAQSWHAGLRWYDDGNGHVFMGLFQRDGRFKQVLAFYKELYESGGLEPDFVFNKGAEIKHDKWEDNVVATNNVFIGSADTRLLQLREMIPDAEIEFFDYPEVELTMEQQKEKPILTQTGIYHGWAITDKGKDKAEHIVSFFNYLLSDEGWDLLQYGVEGVHYKMDDSKRVRLEPAATEFFKWQGRAMMLRRPLDKNFWMKKLIPEIYPLQEKWFEKSIDTIKDDYIQKGLAGFVSKNEQEFKKKDIWTTKLNEISMKIIVGDLPLSAWDNLIIDVYKNGWQDVVDEYNDYYNVNR